MEFVKKDKTEEKEVQELKEVKEVEKVQPAAKEAPVKKEHPKQFVMVKNYVGNLVVSLEPYDFSTPARKIRFKHNEDIQYIPAKYALGVFVTNSALKQMDKGYFTFENLEQLIEMAEDLGYYVPDSIKERKITLKELKDLLRAGDAKQMERTLLNASSKTIDDLVTLARKYYDTLNMGVISYIQKTYKVDLKPVNLDE